MSAPVFGNNTLLGEFIPEPASHLHQVCRLVHRNDNRDIAALAWLIASFVWGITPSSAATTSTTMSVTFAPRALKGL